MTRSRPGWGYRFRGAAFIAVLVVSLVIYAPVVAICRPLPFRFCHWLSVVWCRFFVRTIGILGGITHRIKGLYNVPDEPCIFFSKHQSAWETLSFETFLPPYVWIIKREALWIPFFGWGLAALRPIAIDRGAHRKAVEQIRVQGVRRLREGLSVMIFPEGTRVPVGTTRRFGLGGAILATAADVKVVPIAHNSGLFWPGKKLSLARPGTIDVVIGEPVSAAGQDPEELTARLKAWIDSTVVELEKGAEP